MIKLQCVGCKSTRDITLNEARAYSPAGFGPMCPKCGMPEYAVSARVKARRRSRGGVSQEDLRNVFKNM